MEDTGRVRLIIIGIILAIVAGGYFLFTQVSRVFRARTQSTQQTVTIASPSPSPYNIVIVTPTPFPGRSPGASPVVGGVGSDISKGGLPKTGFPAALAGIFAASAIISGFFLRKYPK